MTDNTTEKPKRKHQRKPPPPNPLTVEQGRTAHPEVVATVLVARAAGATTGQAAALAGCSDESVRNYENGKSPVALARVTAAHLESKKRDLAHKHYLAADVALESLLANEGADIKKASPAQRSVMSGIHTQRGTEILVSDPRLPGTAENLGSLSSVPEGRAVLAGMARLLAKAIETAKELPEGAIDAEYTEMPSKAK